MSLLAEVANCAAYHSLLVGELPPLPGSQAANALAECGLLGAPLGGWGAGWVDGIRPEEKQCSSF